MFEWNEDKRLTTIEKHGIDFYDAAEIFAKDYLRLEAASELEKRSLAIGELRGICIAVVFTMREDVTRIITARRARKNERELYQAHVTRRDAENEKPN
ncbi:BrnT family toxin [Ruegeria pomeroyi]|uniref:BrnT family toxin n=1 Tax=Ruegeria pomeroyi TaxID=89184 RepID=UPI001F21D407|nr:BrnT family toxin [Ruegeria pomeroyi]MCE8507288.1 BrnT family toxin [Ruegeria pomeroyi]